MTTQAQRTIVGWWVYYFTLDADGHAWDYTQANDKPVSLSEAEALCDELENKGYSLDVWPAWGEQR